MPEHICPWWIGYFLASPLRRFFHKPEQIVAPYLKEGMTVLEVGPGMGFFTLPMARMVGSEGKIICIDVQERMIKSLVRRASRAGLTERIKTRLTSGDSLQVEDFANRVDFALLFAVVHEVSDQEKLFQEVHTALKSEALMLLSEPRGHVSVNEFNKTLTISKRAGFDVTTSPEIKRNHSVALKKLHS